MKMNNTLTLRNDYLFKLLLGSEKNKTCLQDFLECVLDMETDTIIDIELLDKELAKDAVTDKTGILDVKVRLKDETMIDIEIQNSWSTEFIPQTLFYWAKLYTEGFREGAPYTSLTKCITINLVSQGFQLNTQVHSVYSILERESYQPLTALLEIHFLNLSRAEEMSIQKEAIEKEQKLINWLRFINTDDQKERTMLATTSPILHMLNEQIDVLSLTPVERKLYESRMKLKSDIATISEVQFKSGLEVGFAEGLAHGEAKGLERGKSLGRAEGKAEGSHQKALETAKNLLHFGLSRENIAQATGLTMAEIKSL